METTPPPLRSRGTIPLALTVPETKISKSWYDQTMEGEESTKQLSRHTDGGVLEDRFTEVDDPEANRKNLG